MPTYHAYKWGDYKASVRPTGARRLFRWYPYFNGSQITLILKVTHGRESREFSYEWFLYRWDGRQEHHVRQGGDVNCKTSPQHSFNDDIVLPKLFIPGQHILKLAMSSKESDATFDRQVLADFNIIERDSTTMKLILAFLGIISAAFVGILVTLLVG